MKGAPPRVALVFPGDREARRAQTLEGTRLQATAAALAAAGIAVEAAVWADEFADEVRARLLRTDAALVWVNPIERGRDRTVLDALLREVARHGVWVSAHPDAILAIGTKDVLYATREMAWGGDTRRYDSAAELRARLPRALASGTARVLKRHRGNGGNGVWKVELAGSPDRLRVRHALRGSLEEEIALDAFLARCEPYFEHGGRVIDQAYQPRLTEGTVRCYLVGDRVEGFGEQRVNALHPPPPGAGPESAPAPGPRLYYPPDRPDFRALKAKLESEWVAQMCRLLALERDRLPALWDADFLYGPKGADGADTWVLCEINASSVLPFPEHALAPLARHVRARLAALRA